MHDLTEYHFIHFTAEATVAGIERYGRLLAAEARLRNVVYEHDIAILAGIDRVPAVARDRPAVFIFQFSPNRYPRETLRLIRGLLDHYRPDRFVFFLIVLHDALNIPCSKDALFRLRLYRRPRTLFQSFYPDPTRDALGEIGNAYFGRVRFTTFSDTQIARLPAKVAAAARPIPHFVENPISIGSEITCKRTLGLEGRFVITVLGFVDPRKNCEMAIRALVYLPETYVLVLAGKPLLRPANYGEYLLGIAAKLGLEKRVRITGYLSDSDQALHIGATDLALCVFKSVSASGTLSTWIAHEKPVLISDSQELALYSDSSGSSLIKTQAPDPKALGQHILSIDEIQMSTARAGARLIKERLSIANVWMQFRDSIALLSSRRL